MSTSVWQRMRALVAFVTMIAAGCGGGQQNCSTDAFIYRDLRCDAPSTDGGARCLEVGNGDCYARCAMDGQCSTSASFCRTLGLYSGGGFVCNSSGRVCRPVDLNQLRALIGRATPGPGRHRPPGQPHPLASPRPEKKW